MTNDVNNPIWNLVDEPLPSDSEYVERSQAEEWLQKIEIKLHVTCPNLLERGGLAEESRDYEMSQPTKEAPWGHSCLPVRNAGAQNYDAFLKDFSHLNSFEPCGERVPCEMPR